MAHPYYHGFTQSTQRGTLYPGQTILVNRHNVQVERYLSQGGFAHVYVVRSAVPINNNTQHVLKRIAVADPNMLKEVQKEVEVMRKLRGHPNIVDFIDASWHALPNGGYEVFILMEFCAGGGLIDMMNRRLRERLTEAEIFQIFVDVCEAVAVMHSQNPPILHRDLKIENILQASATLYKLCDFGSAAPVSPRHPSSIQELRELEADLGRHTTLQYRAPEMVDVYQRRHIDQKSDIWALGVLLYKLCYYTTPFEEHGPLAILNVQYRIPPYPVYSREMNALIASMLQELGTQRPTVFELLNTVHQLRGTKSRFNYAAASQKPMSLSLHPSSSSRDEFRDLITSRSPPKPVTNAIPMIPENIVPMRRGRPVSAVLSTNTVLSKEPDAIPKESKNPWLTAKPTTTQDKFDDAWLLPGQKKSQEPTGTGFNDSFSASIVEKKVEPRPNPSPQPVSRGITPIANIKSSRDAFDGLAGIPQAQALPTLGEAAQGFKSGLKVPSKPPPLRGVISRSPHPQPTQPAQSPISPRMSASRTGLAAYRSSSISVEQRYPSLEDLDRSWNPSNPVSRPSVVAPVTRPELPGKTTSISNPNISTTSKFGDFDSDNSTLAKDLIRDKAPSLPAAIQSSSFQTNSTAISSLHSPSVSPAKKDIPIGSSPAKYRPSRPALARKRLSIQPTTEDLPASIPPAPRDWLTGEDSSPLNNTTMLPKESTPTLTTSFKPLPSSNIPAQKLDDESLIKPLSSPTKLSLPLPSRSTRTSPSNDYSISRSPEPEPADDSSSDEAEGPEEIASTPLGRTFKRPERRQSSVHDLVDLYGGGSRFQPSKIPSPSKPNRRTSGTLIDVSVSGSSDFLSPSSIVPKSQAELVNRHFRSRSNSPAETKPLPSNEPRKLSPRLSPITPASDEWRSKRPQSMLLVNNKPKPESPALLQLPAEEPHPKRNGRRSSISDMVSLYENLGVNSNQKIPPPVAQKPPALKSKASPTQFRYPAISPTGTSFPSRLTDPLPPPKPLPRRSSTYDYVTEDRLNIQKEPPVFMQYANGRPSASPVSSVSPVLEASNSLPPSEEPPSSLLKRSPISLETSLEPNIGISSPSPERPYQGVSQLISQWQRKSEEAEETRRNVIRGRGRPFRGRI